MTATTIPEVIVPSELLAYTGQDFMTVATVPLPNGNNSLLNTSSATSAQQKAWQARRTDSHLLLPAGDNSMSFWFRRRGSFSPVVSLSAASTGATSGTINGMIMGVGNPTGTSLAANANNLAWALWASTATSVQFGMGMNLGSRLFCSGSIQLTLDTWHFIVINVDAIGANPIPNTTQIWRDGALQSSGAPVVAAGYFLQPSTITNFAEARFALGDPTNTGGSARSVADAPLYDIAKIAFHDRQLTVDDQIGMLEAMRYGPAA